MRYSEVHGHLPLRKPNKSFSTPTSPQSGVFDDVAIEDGEGHGGEKGGANAHSSLKL